MFVCSLIMCNCYRNIIKQFVVLGFDKETKRRRKMFIDDHQIV